MDSSRDREYSSRGRSGASPQPWMQHGQRGGDHGPRNGGWGNGNSDTAPLYDNRQQGGDRQLQQGPHASKHGNQGRRAKHYRKLWEHVKSVHAGDTDGGRHL
jgi:hypothetical protein